MKIDDFLKEEMNWTDRDLEYRPVIGYWKVVELLQKWGEKQLTLYNVVSISDKIVIELSDEELQIVTRQELSKMQDDAMKFDGFEGWIVRGKLAIIK